MLSCENMVLPYWNYLFAKSNVIMHSNFKGIRENLECYIIFQKLCVQHLH
jgi:hypothetical protein